MQPLPDSARPTPNSAFEISVVDEEVILLDPATLRVAHLNGAAALIWRLCDGTRSVADLRELLTAAYPDAAAVIASDLVETIGSLAAIGALTGLEHSPADVTAADDATS